VFEIDPRKWEEIIAANYERSRKFDDVILTPRSGDFGRDIIAVKHGFWSVRIIESVKHYAADHLVRADEVRALSGVLHGDQKATKGILSTTSDFAPRIVEDPYIAPLVPTRLELINGQELMKRLTGALK
jgi:restriction system protein